MLDLKLKLQDVIEFSRTAEELLQDSDLIVVRYMYVMDLEKALIEL